MNIKDDIEYRPVTLQVPTKIIDALETVARRELMSRSDVIRRAIAHDLRQRGELKPAD